MNYLADASKLEALIWPKFSCSKKLIGFAGREKPAFGEEETRRLGRRSTCMCSAPDTAARPDRRLIRIVRSYSVVATVWPNLLDEPKKKNKPNEQSGRN